MYMYPDPDQSLNDRKPKDVQYAGMSATRDTVTEIYCVNGDPTRWFQVVRMVPGCELKILMWDQPRRLWDGSGNEHQKKGYRLPPPPLNEEQQKSLALLFQKLGIQPKCVPSVSTGDLQI